jgi:hypothetical protein
VVTNTAVGEEVLFVCILFDYVIFGNKVFAFYTLNQGASINLVLITNRA